jgi:hypothetical protein
MDTTKEHFIERVNKIGILFIRKRTPKKDLTGWGALEFILKNGEVFVVSGEQFGQGSGEGGLWIDMNKVDDITLNKIKKQTPRIRKKEEDTVLSWLKYQK